MHGKKGIHAVVAMGKSAQGPCYVEKLIPFRGSSLAQILQGKIGTIGQKGLSDPYSLFTGQGAQGIKKATAGTDQRSDAGQNG